MMRKSTFLRKHSPGFLALAICATLVVFSSGCGRGTRSEKPPVHLNPNMDTQEKYKAQSESRFFPDGATMRTPVEHTVARGQLREADIYFRGRLENGAYVETSPVPVTEKVRARGKERFMIFCKPCHGINGDGKGKIMEYKYPIPPTSFYGDKVKNMPDGQIFDVITNGVRNMPSYRQQIPVYDRWCIIAYIRSLQEQGLPAPDTRAPVAPNQNESGQ